ncbi:MAG: sigma factor, partial [Candidatus Lambdaproteobacteria bacterium]
MPTKQNPYTEKTQQSREDQLIKYAPLVKRVVTRMAARFPPGVDQEELYQVGMIGLLDAVDKFDPT